MRFDERDVETAVMGEPLRHRQTKEAATDMFSLQPPRHSHISTLPQAVSLTVRISGPLYPRKPTICCGKASEIVMLTSAHCCEHWCCWYAAP
jgi:hypothetical protein